MKAIARRFIFFFSHDSASLHVHRYARVCLALRIKYMNARVSVACMYACVVVGNSMWCVCELMACFQRRKQGINGGEDKCIFIYNLSN